MVSIRSCRFVYFPCKRALRARPRFLHISSRSRERTAHVPGRKLNCFSQLLRRKVEFIALTYFIEVSFSELCRGKLVEGLYENLRTPRLAGISASSPQKYAVDRPLRHIRRIYGESRRYVQTSELFQIVLVTHAAPPDFA